MIEQNHDEHSDSSNPTKTEEEDTFNIVGFDADSPSRSVFTLFGYEFIAPSGMKNPAFIYLLFVLFNLFIFLFIKSKL
tara:strand:+ start:658 stop:891 length:234 start_codon:yes stop_codon:yes gene_type:complete